MQNSKLPKLTNFKPENRVLLSEAQAAPASNTNQNAIMRAPLRRSRSVTDLTTVTDQQPLNNLPKVNKLNLRARAAPIKTAPAIPTATLKTTKPPVGTKRPLDSQSEDGATKPKVFKKIPDSDYKARFNQLNEKYQISQNALKTMKEDVLEIQELRAGNTELTAEVKRLTRDNQNLYQKLETQTSTIQSIEEKNRHLISTNQGLEADLTDALHWKQQLQTENEKLLKDSKEFCGKIHSLNASSSSVQDRISDFELRASNAELTTQVTRLTQDIQRLTRKTQTTEDKNRHLHWKQQLQTENEKLLNDQLSESIKKNKALEDQNTGLKQELIWFESERRIWHNVIQDLKGNIRVFCRVRPRLTNEENKLECSISFPEENSLVLRRKNKSQDGQSEFRFDKVFGPSSSQENIFDDLEQLVQSALDGYNVCVFAYGQTGSGKTYTMQGGEGPHQGVIPRTILRIFERIEKLKRTGWDYFVQVSFVHIYNENARDLLNLSSSQRLDICFNEGRGTTVNNLTQQTVETASELESYMKKAHLCRATVARNFSEHSSRSHAITKICLKGVNQEQNLTYEGSINLVDLAGSESPNPKNAIGKKFYETKNINKSLALLGDVICALFNKSRNIPYRNSKLTLLLQSSLSGNSKTLMIVNIAPFEECFGESLSALRFAAKVKEKKNA